MSNKTINQARDFIQGGRINQLVKSVDLKDVYEAILIAGQVPEIEPPFEAYLLNGNINPLYEMYWTLLNTLAEQGAVTIKPKITKQ